MVAHALKPHEVLSLVQRGIITRPDPIKTALEITAARRELRQNPLSHAELRRRWFAENPDKAKANRQRYLNKRKAKKS